MLVYIHFEKGGIVKMHIYLKKKKRMHSRFSKKTFFSSSIDAFDFVDGVFFSVLGIFYFSSYEYTEIWEILFIHTLL